MMYSISLRAGCALLLCFAGVVRAADADAAAGHGMMGLVVYIVGIVIVAWVFIYTVRCFLRPGEHDSRHVKRRILRDGW